MNPMITSHFARRRLLKSLAAGAAVSWGASVLAQDASGFPSQPITIVVPMAAGGSTDYAARLFARKLSEAFRNPALVDNKPGASGAIGASFVARAPADGHTLLLAPSTVAVVNPLVSKVSYDINKDFRPVGMLAKAETVLVASRRSGIQSIADVIREAKAQPGKLTYGSNGQGSALHLAAEFLAQLAEIDMLHVPYKGASLAETALLAGEVDLLVTNTVSVIQHVKAGTVVPLAILSSAPSQQLPQVPQGSQVLPGYVADTWVAVYAPRATNDATVAKLNTALNNFLSHRENAAEMISRGLEPAPGTTQEATRFQQAEEAKWSKVVASMRASNRL